MKLETTNRENVPLQSVDVEAKLYDFFGDVTVKTIFENNFDRAIEAIYYFTLDKSAVVHNFHVKVGGKNLVGVVREKSVAKQTYEAAKDNKQTTSLLEKNSDGSYKMALGNIQSYDIITIEYSYLVQTVTENGKYKFVLPTNIGEKYTPHYGYYDYYNRESNSKVTHSATVPYKFHVSVNWKSKGMIKNTVISPNVTANITQINQYEYHVETTTVPASGDFVLTVEADVSNNVYVGQTENGLYNILISQVPDNDEEIVPKEFVFLLDKSGSMDGKRINDAKAALTLFVQSLPAESKFNVIMFDSSYSAVFSNSVEYNEENKKTCIDVISKVKGSGGTEMYNCIRDSLNGQLRNSLSTSAIKSEGVVKIPDHKLNSTTTPDMERVYVLLTDGEISDSERVINIVKNASDTTRFFTIGVGNSADRNLIESIADVSNGLCKMVLDEATLGDVVIGMLESVYKTQYKNVVAQFGNESIQYSGRLYPGKYITLFNKSKQIPDDTMNVKISGVNCTSGEVKEWNIEVNKNDVISPNLIELLYVNNSIKNGKLSRTNIADLSVKYNIMNEFTSFIMVDETVNHAQQSAAISINVPHVSSGRRMDECERACQLDSIDCASAEVLQQSAEFSRSVRKLSARQSSVLESAYGSARGGFGGSVKACSAKSSGFDMNFGIADGLASMASSISNASKGIFSSFGSSNACSASSFNSSFEKQKKMENYSTPDLFCDDDDEDECDSNSTSPKKSNSLPANSVKESKTSLPLILQYHKTDGHFVLSKDSYSLIEFKFDSQIFEALAVSRNMDKELLFNMLVLLHLEAENKSNMKMIVRNLRSWIRKSANLTDAELTVQLVQIQQAFTVVNC